MNKEFGGGGGGMILVHEDLIEQVRRTEFNLPAITLVRSRQGDNIQLCHALRDLALYT